MSPWYVPRAKRFFFLPLAAFRLMNAGLSMALRLNEKVRGFLPL